MAKIVASDKAPSGEKFSVSTAQVEFTPPYETDDPDVIANAKVHPWLTVEEEEGVSVEAINPYAVTPTEPYNANDPDLVRAELERRGLLVDQQPGFATAIDAELSQDEPVVKANTARTIAADDKLTDAAASDDDTKGGK